MARILDTAAAPRWTTAHPSAYVQLAKPKAILPHLVTTASAMVLAAGGVPPASTLAFTLLGEGCVAAAANILNCVLDRDIDAVMRRTRERPLPSGRARPGPALVLATAAGLFGTAILAGLVNRSTAALASLALVYYVVGYTIVMKRRTCWSSVLGSPIGAIPPLIGWTAVTDGVRPAPFLLGAIIVLWTFPHFWSLAFVRREEYAEAGLTILPGRGVGVGIAVSSSLLVASSLLLAPLAGLGALYVAAASVLAVPLLWLAARINRPRPERAARRLFTFSIVYVATLFGALIVDRLSRL